MPKAVALKLQSQSALAVVVRTSGARIEVEAIVPVELAAADDPKAVGEKIAAALVQFGVGRAPTVLTVPRAELHWANYDLPPAPPEELPSLVELQAQRDFALADDGLGFDYLSLEGDHEHPHRVLGVGLAPAALERARTACTAAGLQLLRIVPVPFGWVELGRAAVRAAPSADAAALTVFTGIAGRQAAVWAMEGDVLRMVRTAWLAAEPDAEADLAALAGELRRTLLSLADRAGGSSASLPMIYCGEDAERIANQLAVRLSRPVRAVRLEDLVDAPTAELAEIAPLAALAAAAAAGRPSPVDLLHPHRPPAPPSQRRTYTLAGVAAASLVLALLWYGYRRINSPLAEAAEANAKLAQLAPTLDRLAVEEEKAAAVDVWLGESANLLTELNHLALQLRPKPLADGTFNSAEDLVLTKLALAGRQLTIDASARSTDALQPIERRLRDGDYRVMRGVVESQTEGATPGYAARISEVLERIGAKTDEDDAETMLATADMAAKTPVTATGGAATPAATTTTNAPATSTTATPVTATPQPTATPTPTPGAMPQGATIVYPAASPYGSPSGGATLMPATGGYAAPTAAPAISGGSQ